MRRLFTLAIASLLLASLLRAAAEPPRLLMISIDGLMPSSYTSAGPAKIPTLRRLAAEGASARGVVGVLPSVTYPSHTTLITGVPPAVHGIVDNRILDPENRSNGAWYWYATEIEVQTLPMVARARGLTTGAVSWPVTVGMDLDWLVPEYFPSRHPQGVLLLDELIRPPGLRRAMETFRGRPFGWPYDDRDRTDQARAILRLYAPHVFFLHLIDLDQAEHDHGPGSAEALATLERIDEHVQQVLEAFEAPGRTDRAVVAIVSDHGFRGVEQQLQPNALFKREGLLTAGAGGRITDWQAYFHSSGGAGFVFLKKPEDAALVTRVKTLLESLKQDPAHGIDALWGREELRRFGAHPEASFGIGMARGFYSSADHDVLMKPSTSRGGHGFDPTSPDLHASLILRGGGFTGGRDLGIVRMTQIAPTLAKLLGLGLAPEADRPIALEP